MTLRADFLLSTLRHRGVTWARLPCTLQWTETDSEVCAYLKSVFPNFDAEGQLASLEMKEDIVQWQLQSMSQEAMSAAVVVGMSKRAIADDHDSISQKRVTAAFVYGKDAQDASSGPGLPVPVDISGLVPPPRASFEDRPTRTINPTPLETIEEEPAREEDSHTGSTKPALFEKSAETLARWIEGMSDEEEQAETEKTSKTKKRNAQRRKAKARASEATSTEGHAYNSERKEAEDIIEQLLRGMKILIQRKGGGGVISSGSFSLTIEIQVPRIGIS